MTKNNKNKKTSAFFIGKKTSENTVPETVSSPAPAPRMKRRMFLGVLILFLLFTVYVTYALFNTSVLQMEYYRSKANQQQLTSYTITANRGAIYDRNNKILAQSTTVWDVVLSPLAIHDADEELKKAKKEPKKDLICAGLAQILDVDKEKIRSACSNTKNQFYIVRKKVDKTLKDRVEEFIAENKLPGNTVYLMESSKRYYPNDGLASTMIGFTNYDNEGVYGLEAYYDDYLQGVDGLIVMATDAHGNAMPYDYENRYEASDGNSIVTTIDSTVQYFLEKNLEIAVQQHKVANRATGIIMNAKTGAIVAMSNAPGYNLNDPSHLSDVDRQKLDEYHEQLILDYMAGNTEDQNEIDKMIEADMESMESSMRELQWKNKAISELYFPGSVFKVITCASALEEEVISLDTTFTCNWIYTVDDTKFHCWTSAGHGVVDLQHAITASCNPSFIQIGLALGDRLFCDYFKAFGFTEKTGIDLPGEASPLYVPYERMGKVELASSAFGQTNKITPIQMICAYAAAINGGYLVTPHVVDKIIDKSGNVVKSIDTTIKRQVISGETSKTMREITENIVSANGGMNAYIPGYRIGGKSGTSQKLDEYKDYEMRYVGSFCAFTPADDPEYIMLVCVDEPMGGKYYGSNVAAPVVSAVFSECLEYLGVYPQYTADELAQQDTTVPYLRDVSLLDAITTLNSKGLQYEIIGEGMSNTVAYSIPSASESIPKSGTVMLYMQGAEEPMVTVPDLTGYNVELVNTLLTNKGLNVSLSGGAINNASALASGQSIEPGKQVPRGTVVTVTFTVNSDEG